MADLRDHDVDLLTVGQYLQPDSSHLPVERFWHPDEYAEIRAIGERLGFAHVEAGPFVRSSYHAGEQARAAGNTPAPPSVGARFITSDAASPSPVTSSKRASMPDPYDVAVIGAGPGGYVAAIRAAQLGLKAAIIEKDAVGGTCLNWGCIPSKALLYSAELLNLYKRGPEFGITTGEVTGDLGVSVDRSRDVVAKFVAGVEGLLQQNKVDLIRGAARLEAPDRVRIDPSGDVTEAANVIIATGGVSRSLPNVPVDGDRVITSREALELRDMPIVHRHRRRRRHRR